MNRKNAYKNKEKWRETCHLQRLRYYRKTANAENNGKPWTPEEIEMVMFHKMPDQEISKIIGRSVMAIQLKRTKESRKRVSNVGRL